VRVIGLRRRGEEAPPFEQDQGVLVWRLDTSDDLLSWFSARRSLYRAVAGWAKNQEIDVVEAPDYLGITAYWPTIDVPVISRFHGSSGYYAAELGTTRDRKTFYAERASLRRADSLCATSSYVAERTKAIFRLTGREVQVIYNTVPSRAQPTAISRSRYKVVFSGILTEKKGILSLMRAWPAVVRECQAAELHIYGKDYATESSSSMWEHAVSTIADDIRSSVHFHGHVSSIALRDALQTARVAIFPSYAEAFALAPMEAMAEGCPTIYTRRSSGSELINDGADGLLVDPDKPNEIARAIVRVLSNDDLAATLGNNGRQRILRDFSFERMVGENERYYEECIRNFGARTYLNERYSPGEAARNSQPV
jgi:glycosyltransferase involved in cell wall biosynthesis